MKKFVLVLAVLAVTATAFSSCRKCKTCKAYDRQTNAQVDSQEYCGLPRLVDDNVEFYENLWNDSYTYAQCK